MKPSEMGTSGGGCHSNATKDKVSEGTARLDRQRVCAASSKPLKAPIVVCDLGHLLNKEDVIEMLLAKTLPSHLAHIRSLKNLHDATFHANPAFVPTSGHVQGADDDEPPFACPIASLPMNGRFPFVYIRPTGHVVSQRALKQVGGRLCPITEEAIGADATIPINPSDDERNALLEQLTARKALAAEARRKAKVAAAAEGSSGTSSGACIAATVATSGTVGTAGSAGTANIATTVSSSAATPSLSAAAAAASLGGPSTSTAGGTSTSTVAASASAAVERSAPVPAKAAGPERTSLKADGRRAAAERGDAGGRRGGGSGKRPQREWERSVEAKAQGSSVYKSLFLSAEERAKQQEAESANFCARGIVPSLSRSTKFGLG